MNSAGISVETTTGYGENYIGAFVNELTGYTPPVNKGSVDYRWHEVGVGPLSDSATVTGTATTTLTISNLRTPTDNGRQFFLQVDYDPDTATGIGSMKITGNAPNEPFNSGISTVTVTPLVEITTQPVVTSTFPNVATDITVVASLTDNSFGDDTQYQWQLDGSDVSNGTITKNGVDTVVAGATSPTLTLTSNNSGISYNVRCSVSSATASNSLIVSDSVTYTVNVPTNVINIEAIKNAGTQAVLSNVDLSTGDIIFTAATSSTASDFFLYSLYAPNKDVDVEMDLQGGQGLVGNARGGYGGYSRIRFTMKQNEEYVIAGLTEAVKTPFVYHKASLIACVGGGGDAATGNTQVSNGGAGGGVNIGGETPAGGASGGQSIVAGTLGGNGIFGSSFQSPTLYIGDTQQSANSGGAGVTIKCTKGVYYAQQGISPCADVAVSGKFRISDGTEITNTANIERGYKTGYNIIQTAGVKTNSTGGNGGHGMEGGQGGGYNSPGGGGSGYHDGSVTVVSTMQGGSTGGAKIIIRLQT